jgi:hypothetical protein
LIAQAGNGFYDGHGYSFDDFFEKTISPNFDKIKCKFAENCNHSEGVKKLKRSPLTLPSPTRGEGKHYQIKEKNSLPFEGGGLGWG